MKAIVTGARGAVGAALVRCLQLEGATVSGWDRSIVPIGDSSASESYLKKEQPDVLFHLAIASKPTDRQNEGWFVNCEWPVALAGLCASLGIRFVFTSSVMVFSDVARGPFTVDSLPDAEEGYGYEKRMAEVGVLKDNPEAVIARLGWQIGERPGANNMVDYLETQTLKERLPAL